MRKSILILLIAAALAVCSGQTRAQNAYVLTPDSRLRIEGKSTVDDFTCEAGILSGSGRVEGPQAGASDGNAAVELTVPVESFDCGKARMNRDMYEALQASAHPNIEFSLTRVEVLKSPASGDANYNLQVVGQLSLAGTMRHVTMDVLGSVLPDGRLRARGDLSLLMTDFGVTPPTALLGLVRAHDRITVAFDLYGVRQGVAHAMR